MCEPLIVPHVYILDSENLQNVCSMFWTLFYDGVKEDRVRFITQSNKV